jgi:predicted AlkP superfamily pyrophosphatase or phosphodiesterase
MLPKCRPYRPTIMSSLTGLNVLNRHASLLPCFHTSLLIIFLLFALCSSLQAQSKLPYLVMLSMDGFRWDYPEKCPTPNLDKIAAAGVKAHSLQPAFPSKTFANHYTMATGLYPDHHGIVDNSFFDPGTGKTYSIGNRNTVEDPIFYGGEPIWVTAEKQGIISASFYWVGSEARIQGMQPTYWKRYDHEFPFEQRIDTVIYWLNLPEEKRPHLILWYFDEPDGTGHGEGPESEATCKMVTYLDSLVGVFLEKIYALHIAGEVNIIITSDHGMGSVSPGRCIRLKDYLDYSWFEEMEGYTPNLTFKVKKEFADTAWKALTAIPHSMVWQHGKVPDSLHYGTNPRTLDFILCADSAWQFTLTDKIPHSAGNHGYNPFDTDMHAIFYARGPAFKTGYIHPTFENIDLYPLICLILNLKPVPVDGNLDKVRNMLKD